MGADGTPAAKVARDIRCRERIQAWAGTNFSYDANGNLTSDALTSYPWNARNQLVGLSGGTSASFAYDGLGRRRTKTIGAGQIGFLYDGVNAVQELVVIAPTANLLTGGVDEVFQRTDAGGTQGSLTDALGSTAALADDSGLVQTSYTYTPFGATTATPDCRVRTRHSSRAGRTMGRDCTTIEPDTTIPR